jgi:F-type H+-transporting ATPase subunit epsilon
MAESRTFNLQILTPKEEIFEGQVTSVVAPGGLGYLGILLNHAPMVSTLSAGKVTAKDAQGKTQHFQSTGEGFLEVYHNQVTLLADEVTTDA